MKVLRPGDLIDGKYRIDSYLGRGGMGMVVSARHLILGEPVALKFLLPDGPVDARAVERFLREARAALRIKSEHVARVLDVGTLVTGEPFMVMELLEGQDLGKVIRERGPLPIQEAVEYVLQACEAIARANELGIVHRDLKPANLFLTKRPDGVPLIKVLDFGISKNLDHGNVDLTQTADMLGSPLYMSPEQIRTPKEVDGRADVWALGAILFKLLSGTEPFSGEIASSVLAKIVADKPTSLRSLRADAPADLESIILSCLKKNVARRMQSADALALALLPFAGERRIDRTAPGATVHNRQIMPTPRASLGPRQLVQILGALGVLALSGVIALLVLRPHLLTPEVIAEPAGAPSASAATQPAAAVPLTSSAGAALPDAPSEAKSAPESSASAPQPSAFAAPSASVSRPSAKRPAGTQRSFTGALDDRF